MAGASGSNGKHSVDILGSQNPVAELCVHESGHFAIFVGSNVKTTCGLITNLYTRTIITVNKAVHRTVFRYFILSLLQGKEWKLLDML